MGMAACKINEKKNRKNRIKGNRDKPALVSRIRISTGNKIHTSALRDGIKK
jgi:hypothetical protein